MSEQNRHRSVWQIVGLYLAGSWLCLQLVDILADRIPLPSWVFLMTLGLLLVGLPITAGTAMLQGVISRRAADEDVGSLGHRLLTWRNVMRGGVGAMAVWGLAVTGWLVLAGGSASQWDVIGGVVEVERLAGESKFDEGFALASELEKRINNDSIRDHMWALVSVADTIVSTPAGATVSRRSYKPGSEWEQIGTTPVETGRIPLGMMRLRFELAGHRTREMALQAAGLTALTEIKLDAEAAVPAGMIRVAGAKAAGGYGLFAPGLEQVAAVDVESFFMASHEVTNRAYKEFVDAGGYADQRCWENPFVSEGRTLTFADAMTRFRDATGRPGPATWDAGSYRRGTAEHPVGGVSWYEAAAYACWRGMSLPTVYHWYRAAGPSSSPHVVPASNFGEGPAPVGTYEGVSRDGISDLAGNVREWTHNANGESRFILGGGWDDQEYSFNDAVTAPAFDRSPMNGIRLVKYADTTHLAAARAPLKLAFRDYRAEKPVSDEVFAALRPMYDYEATPINAKIVDTDSTELWIRQRIDMDAAYGGERLTVFLFLPRTGKAPYQTVVFFPGSGDLYRRSYDDLTITPIDFIIGSGRAVIYPIYKGTFERGTELTTDIQDLGNGWRDHVIAWSKDMRRAIDYSATRSDLDRDRLAYMGISWGGAVAPIMVALEPRIRTAVILVGGLLMQETQPVVDPFNFLPRVKQPTLMMNARYDSFYPLEASGRPYFENLGTVAASRKLVIYDANHGVLGYARNAIVKETLEWLDRYLGPVQAGR